MCDQNVVALDLDDALEDSGEMKHWAWKLVDHFKSYTEYSPFGKGLRIIMLCTAALDNRDCDMLDEFNMPDGKVQFFSNNHFFTVTGANRFGWPRIVEDRTVELQEWHSAFFPAKAQAAPTSAPTGGGLSYTDDELLDEMFGNPKIGDNIRRLWEGDTTGYASHSNADFALMGWLSSYTNKDAGRMVAMFMASGLYRTTDKAAGYVDLTANNAIAKTTWIWPGKPNTVDPQAMADIDAMAWDKLHASAPTGGATGAPNGTQQQTGGTPPPPPPQPPKSPFLSFDELMALPPKQWLVEGVFGERDIVMVYGEPGSGKTFVLMDLVFAACQGKQWANKFDVTRPLTVAYCAGEGVSGLKDRFAAAKDHWGITTLPNFYFLPFAPQLFANSRADAIKAQVALFKAHHGDALDLLIIDTLHAATAGADENSAKDMGLALTAVRDAIRELGCTVILCHHTAKDGERERGSSALHGAMDAMIKVKKNGEHSIECFKLKDGEPWKPQQFTLIAKGPSVYVFWDGDVKPGQAGSKSSTLRDEIYQTLLAEPFMEFCSADLEKLLGESQKAINKQLNQLFRLDHVERRQETTGRKVVWWKLHSAIAAVQSAIM